MFFNLVLLSICVSIDSLGIGLTYGIKNTKISLSAKLVLFIISFIITVLSLLVGELFFNVFSPNVSKLIGTIIILGMGIWIIYQSFIPQIIKNPTDFDIDKSNRIDAKEAIYLGIALSLDSVGISIGSSIIGINSLIFPICIAFFHLLFLSFGSILGNRIRNISNIPQNIWSLISGILLVLIGLSKMFF